MNIRQILLAGALAAVTVTLVATSSAWADKPGQSSRPKVTRGIVPEIDAASGTSAIALLTGVLLLAGERRRRSS